MKRHIVILGAGFAGLELATRLSESLAHEVRVTLLDQNDSFGFGFSKLDVMLGRKKPDEVLLRYADIDKEGVEFRRERVTSIDPERRRVTTTGATYDADVLVVALGADYDYEATPGFREGGFEFYSFTGAERLREALPQVSGRIVIAILGHPFKCPPAPFEGALLLHDHLVERGARESSRIRVLAPMSAPVPVASAVSESILEALVERGIEYVPNQRVVRLDTEQNWLELEGGSVEPYDFCIGIPVHRVPAVLETSGLTAEGWVQVDAGTLRTPFEGVYALGDVAGAPVAKAGAFAEAAAAIVAEDIEATIRGGRLERRFEGVGSCYLEFGGGLVAKVEANFLGGPKPTARLVGPSRELAAEKDAFGATRRARWFGT